MTWKRKSITDTVLKANTSCRFHEQYFGSEWTRVYTDGCKIQDITETGIYSKPFFQYTPVGHFMSNFDAYILAISLALENIKIKIDCFSKTVILVDFKATIQEVVIKHDVDIHIISEIRQTHFYYKHNKKIISNWIISYMGVYSNETVDLLAKREILDPQDNKPLPPESHKKHIFEKLVDSLKSDQVAKSTDKFWANIQDSWIKCCQKSCVSRGCGKLQTAKMPCLRVTSS
ncbi:hypothetical protein TNCV_1270091 [Trichonephila clavipes]|nr:hypothetical protein TNCV_1270091 [Trichonephila clavipes]